MATVVKNEENFKVLKLSQREARRIGWGTIHGCVCMHCNDIIQKRIYYVACLNDCMCDKCFNKYIKEAEHYTDYEDIEVENRNFNYYKNLLKVEDDEKSLEI